MTAGNNRPADLKVKHGSSVGYTYYGCRCDECKEFQRTSRAEYRSRKRGREKTREYSRLEGRALRELRRRHYIEYREIYMALRDAEAADV